MAYVKNNWVDREGITRYFETVDDDGALIFTPDYTQVTELGTPVNADNMNHIEEGIAAGSFTKYDSMATYAKNDLVTIIVDNNLKVYKSLQDNNTNALDDSSFWEEVEFSGGGGAGLQMFDTVLKDHILTFEESKGLALQGTYVYKEAVAGSRYGYADFYNKCLEEYTGATSEETINGVIVKVHSNGHKFYNISDKESIDSFFDTIGSAWFYGVDTENERIFLPRNNWFEQMTGDGSEVGQSVEAGLPPHTHTRGTMNITGSLISGSGNRGTSRFGENGSSVSGAFYKTSSANAKVLNETDNNWSGFGLGLDASRSWTGETSQPTNEIYGNSDTVQPNAVKKLLYICVGNTEVTSAVTDVTEVTTTENDTIPLGYSVYQANGQPSVSYLKSEGQWNDGNVYTTFYNEFVNKIGEPFASGYVKEVTDEYDDYDLVINQDDMTFRLPLLDGSEGLPSDKHINLTLGANGDTYIAPANGWYSIHCQNTASVTDWAVILRVNSKQMCTASARYNKGSSALTSIYCKKGDELTLYYDGTLNTTSPYWFTFIYAQGNGSLYFKVANAVQNLELLDAGEVLEAVNNVVPNNRTVWDGQWVYSIGNVFSSRTFTANEQVTFDISSYLPNDNYIYEVIFNCFGRTGNTSGNSSGSSIKSSVMNDFIRLGRAVTRASSSTVYSGNAIIPIGTDRTLIYVNVDASGTSGNTGLQMLGYRRMGTNQ